MRKFAKFVFALALFAAPMYFTSCESEEERIYVYNDLVTEAILKYRSMFPNGLNSHDAYMWFVQNYPRAYAEELAAFMEAVGFGRDAYEKNDSQLMQQAQMLIGEWEGTMVYSFIDDYTKKRTKQTYRANMKFFQYSNSKETLSGHGVEVDVAEDGSKQTLEFKWSIDNNGDIYITYTNSGTKFRMSAASRDQGFHLGYDKETKQDSFYGYAISTNTPDEFYIDLFRVASRNMKSEVINTKVMQGAASGKSFGKAQTNEMETMKLNAVKSLRARQ